MIAKRNADRTIARLKSRPCDLAKAPFGAWLTQALSFGRRAAIAMIATITS